MQGQIQALCAQHGVQIYATQEPSMPVPPDEFKLAGETELPQLSAGWRARREIQDLKANLRVGMRKRIQLGLHGSGGRVPYGYRRQPGKNKPHVIDEAEARWVRWMFHHRAKRWGYRSITRELDRLGVPTKTGTGHWGLAIVQGILHNDYYIGVVRWREFENQSRLHEPIVSDELWNQVQAINNRRAVSYARVIRPLSSLAECGLCGHALLYSGNKGWPARYLRCSHANAPTGDDICPGNHHAAKPIEDKVRERFKAIVGDPDIYFDEQEASQPTDGLRLELEALEAQLARATRKREQWDAAYENETVSLDEFARHRNQYKQTTDALCKRKAQLQGRISAMQATRDSIATLQEIVDIIDELTGQQLNELYRQVIDRVTVNKDRAIKIILL